MCVKLFVQLFFIIHFIVSCNTFQDMIQELFYETENIPNKILDNDNVVKIDTGFIRGKKLISRDGRNYLAFLGIPYAKPPVGKLRFMPPEPPIPWYDILDARNPKPECIQLVRDLYGGKSVLPGKYNISGSEDCLYLNVFTPVAQHNLSRKKFPVIIFFHGGINTGKGSLYGAQYMMDEDVVLVTCDYRLHVFAHLNLGDSVIRGNLDARDQVQVMKWIQTNIARFGGDKERVTLTGISYGSIMASLHILSPMSKGLFHQAILLSGTILHPAVVVKDPGPLARELANQMQCRTNSSSELVTCLRSIDAGDLTEAVQSYNFGFTIENSEEGEDVILPGDPLNLLQSGKINPVKTIHGDVAAECLVTALKILLNETKETLNTKHLAEILHLEYTKDPEAIIQFIINNYFRPWNLSRDSLLHNLTVLLSDRKWIHPMSTFLRYQLQSPLQPKDSIFLSLFTKVSQSHSWANGYKSIWGKPEIPMGAAHGDDLQYLLPCYRFPEIKYNNPGYEFSKFMVKLWANFATYGKPTTVKDTVQWPSLKPNYNFSFDFDWFELNDIPKRVKARANERIKIWDTINLTELYSPKDSFNLVDWLV